MDVARESAGAGVAVYSAACPPPIASRPFGPLPPAAVAVYGFLLAGAGLTLCRKAGHVDGYAAAGVGGFVLGLACIFFAVRAASRLREAARDARVIAAAVPTDPRLAAARVVTELEDLQRQLDELTEQCATFDVSWTNEDSRAKTPSRPG